MLALVVIMGTIMYLVEHENPGFDSIPRSIYWAIVTVTTVGFGDITPKSPLGQALSAMLMIMGYGVLAVPTGIVSVELAAVSRNAPVSGQACRACAAEGHQPDAAYCRRCGHAM